MITISLVGIVRPSLEGSHCTIKNALITNAHAVGVNPAMTVRTGARAITRMVVRTRARAIRMAIRSWAGAVIATMAIRTWARTIPRVVRTRAITRMTVRAGASRTVPIWTIRIRAGYAMLNDATVLVDDIPAIGLCGARHA